MKAYRHKPKGPEERKYMSKVYRFADRMKRGRRGGKRS